jgi:hypothetical protein
MLFLINKETKTSKNERQMFCFVNHRKHISQDFTTKTNLGEILKWFGCSPVCVCERERERERALYLSMYSPHLIGNYAPESGC